MSWVIKLIIIIVVLVVYGLIKVVYDYNKWLNWYKVKSLFSLPSFVLPTLVYRKKEYVIIGINKDGSFIARRLDTDSVETIYYNQVKIIWN